VSEKRNFLEGFKKADIKKSAEMDIKPRLIIETIGVENGVNVEVLSVPYLVKIPEAKSMSKDNEIWMIDLLHENIEHQFIAQAGSFRYQLGVLIEKHLGGDPKNIINRSVKIWKEMGKINTVQFKGNAEMYKIELLE